MAEEAIVEETVETPEVEPETGKTYEELSTVQGWRDRDEYSGDPENWTDAKTFYKKGMELNPMLRKSLRSVEEKLDQTKSDFAIERDVLTRRLDAQDKRFREELAQRERDAVENGDLKAYDNIQKERQAAVVEAPVETNNFMEQPAVQDFITRNDWYEADEDMTLVADNYSQKLAKRSPGLTAEQNLSRVEAHIKGKFPHKFENPKRKETLAVSPGQRVKPKSNERTYESMPDEFKAGCDRAVQLKWSTKDEYVKNYHDSEEARS